MSLLPLESQMCTYYYQTVKQYLRNMVFNYMVRMATSENICCLPSTIATYIRKYIHTYIYEYINSQ